MKKRFALFLLLGLIAQGSLAHEPSRHAGHVDEQRIETPESGPSKKILDAINKQYVEEVRPIFRAKCFDCHSTETHYPWYYKLPGVRQLLDHDIREGKKHLDMTGGFPFKGHHTVKDQLKSIEKSVREGTMPLWRYRLLHWNARLTEEEKGVILQWVEDSQN